MRAGWAYAALSTVLVAVPVLGTSMARGQNDASTVFVTLNIPKNEGEAEPLTLRLDVGESQRSCGRGNLSINGQDLAQDGNGNGHGALALNDGNFTADWAFSCDKADQKSMLLRVQVTELDGLQIAPFNFSTSFSQTTPRQIYTVNGAAVVNRIHKVAQEVVSTDDTNTPSLEQLQSQIHKLDILRMQARQLESAISAREDEIAELLGKQKKEKKKAMAAKSIQDCDSLECISTVLGGKFRHVAEKVGGDVDEVKAFIALSEDDTLPVEGDDYDYWYGEEGVENENDAASEGYDLKVEKGKWNPFGQRPLTDDAQIDNGIEYTRSPRRLHPVVMATALSIIALCFVLTCLILTLHLHRRRRRPTQTQTQTRPLPIENEKVLFSERHLLTPQNPSCSERRARKQAIKEYIRNIFTHWCRRTTHHQQQQQPPPSPASLPTYESSSIEEEFASFREAVSVVDSIVAAEEGMNRQVPAYTPYVGDEEGIVFRDDESLPPYESEDESASPVDGFHYRYFEGEAGRDGDDRLGYGK